MTELQIDDLIDARWSFDIVADRIWRAWHEPRGVALDALRDRVCENLAGRPTPKALVAHDGRRFLGTVSLIDSDMDERADLGPWVAALWVEPEARRRGVADALLRQISAVALTAGFPALYLCTREELRPYYLQRGWRIVETGVGLRRLSILRRAP